MPEDPDESSDAGRPKTVSDDALVTAVRDCLRDTGDPVVTTAEIEAAVTLSRRGLSDRLRALREDGRLASKEVGARGRVWWVPDAEHDWDGEKSPGDTK